MTQPKPHDPIIFFGTDAFSVPSLIRLLAGGWQVAAVVTKPDARTGRGRQLTPPAVKRLAESKNIPVLQPDSLTEIAIDLAVFKPRIAVVVAYGKLIPAAIMEMFPLGMLNVH